MIELRLPLHQSVFDTGYTRIDIAPRVMGTPGGDYDGEYGYLLYYQPGNETYLITWDKYGTDGSIRYNDFVIISNITLTK